MEEQRHAVDSASATPAAAEGLPAITYDVVRYRGSWRVLHVGKYSAPHPSQQAAIDVAMRAATQDLANGQAVAVRLNRTDGQIFDLTCSAEHA